MAIFLLILPDSNGKLLSGRRPEDEVKRRSESERRENESRERGFVALVVAVEQQHVEVVAVFPYDICVVLQVF